MNKDYNYIIVGAGSAGCAVEAKAPRCPRAGGSLKEDGLLKSLIKVALVLVHGRAFLAHLGLHRLSVDAHEVPCRCPR